MKCVDEQNDGNCFLGFKSVILVDYLEKGKQFSSVYYCTLLYRSCEEVKEKHPDMLRKKLPIHQDNARLYTAVQSMAKIDICGFELLPRPSYPLYLAPSDFHLLSNLKKQIGEIKLLSNEEVQVAVNEYFENLKKSFLKTGIMS